MRRFFLYTLVGICALACSESRTPVVYLDDAPITGLEAEQIYDYAYPLVLMQITQDLMFTEPLASTLIRIRHLPKVLSSRG